MTLVNLDRLEPSAHNDVQSDNATSAAEGRTWSILTFGVNLEPILQMLTWLWECLCALFSDSEPKGLDGRVSVQPESPTVLMKEAEPASPPAVIAQTEVAPLTPNEAKLCREDIAALKEGVNKLVECVQNLKEKGITNGQKIAKDDEDLVYLISQISHLRGLNKKINSKNAEKAIKAASRVVNKIITAAK